MMITSSRVIRAPFQQDTSLFPFPHGIVDVIVSSG
jgi:hypothetical protein